MMKLRLVVFCLFMFLPVVAMAGDMSPLEVRLTDFIKQMYEDQEGIKVKFSSLTQHIREKAQVRNISFAKVPDTNGDGICLVETADRNGRSQGAYVPFKVFLRTKLYVVKDGMQKGDLIRGSDVAVRETYLAGGSTGYPRDLGEVHGKILKKDVQAGTILTLQVLGERLAMQKGDLVDIIARGKSLLVQTKGRTLEKGKVGDVVRVKNIDSGKEIMAKVAGSDTVLVEY